MSSLHLQAPPTSGDGMLEDAVPAFPTGSRPVTWMVKHLYKGHTAETLHSVLAAVVDPRDYNMIYVPFDSRKRANARYAFITFVDADRALSALSKLDGLPWSVIDDRAAQDAKGWKPAQPRPRKVSAALKAYAKLVTSADTGAVRDLSLLD